MLENKSPSFKKYLILFLLTVLGIGIFIFWLATFNFAPLAEQSFQNLKDIKEIAEESHLSENVTQNFKKIQEQFQEGESDEILKERDLGKTQTKKGLRIALVNIVFKAKETWIYLNIKNNNIARVLFRSGDQSEITVVQEGKEYKEIKTEKIIDYPLKDILAGGEEILGVLHFPGIDPNKPFVLFIKGVQIEGEVEHFNFLFKIEP